MSHPEFTKTIQFSSQQRHGSHHSNPCSRNTKPWYVLQGRHSARSTHASPTAKPKGWPSFSIKRNCRGRSLVTCLAQQSSQQPGLLTELFQAIQQGMQQQAGQTQPTPASVTVDQLYFQPPGAESALLRNVSLHLPAMKMGLVYGRSGAGKSTLLQILAGLASATSGLVSVRPQGNTGAPAASTAGQLAAAVGLVFQFPERHFLGTTIQEELTFGWPADPWQRQAANYELQGVLKAVDLEHMPMNTRLRDLSGGYKRRVALAVQLARSPKLLLLDEPLAGLDWQARSDVARVLGKTKQRCTILAVSHDLRELTSLVDYAWRMEPGGILKSSEWPPVKGLAGQQLII